jgi:nicotinic acid phosphoribosyltransferase
VATYPQFYDPARIQLFKVRNAPVDSYGIGSAISTAPPVDFTADIKMVGGEPRAKRGRIPGITPNPRLARVDLAAYPRLQSDDIRAALAYAAETLAQEDILPLAVNA